MGASEYQTHFKDHYEGKVHRYLLCRMIKRNSLPLGVMMTYAGFFGIFLSVNLGLILLSFASASFIAFFILSFINLFYPQKSKNILAYDLWKASQFFHAYVSENDKKAKTRFLNQSLKHLRLFGKDLHDVIENANISLKLPDINQLKLLQKNVMERIYPLLQDGKNPNDILLSLSKIFFYEVDYKKIPKLNSTMEQAYPPQTGVEVNYDSMARIKQSTVLKCIISDLVVVIAIFGGIYGLKYPIAPSEYWAYLGSSAATIVGVIMASTLAIILFFYRGKQKS